MLQKNEGYFLADMLLSLAAFMMASTFLLPYVVYVMSQTIEVRNDAGATQVLFDELMYIKITGTESSRTTIIKNDVLYHVAVDKNDNKPSWEVCIHYEGEKQRDFRKCAYVE
jgi:competence protein ComGE